MPEAVIRRGWRCRWKRGGCRALLSWAAGGMCICAAGIQVRQRRGAVQQSDVHRCGGDRGNRQRGRRRNGKLQVGGPLRSQLTRAQRGRAQGGGRGLSHRAVEEVRATASLHGLPQGSEANWRAMRWRRRLREMNAQGRHSRHRRAQVRCGTTGQGRRRCRRREQRSWPHMHR